LSVPAYWPRNTVLPRTGALAALLGPSTSEALTVVWFVARPSRASTRPRWSGCREATVIHSTERVIFGRGAPPPGGDGVVRCGTVTAGVVAAIVVSVVLTAVSVVLSVVVVVVVSAELVVVLMVVVVVMVVVAGELVLVVVKVVVVMGGVYVGPWPAR
jgi:hypothetical protein